MIRSSRILRTARGRAAIFWSQPTAVARVCGGNSCRTPGASIPVSPPSPANLSRHRADRIARPLLDGITLVAARRGYGLFVAIQEMSGGAVGSIGTNDPAFAGAGNIFENTRSYLMWALSAKRAKFVLPDLESADAPALAAAARRPMTGWARAFRDLVDLSDPTTLTCLTIRTSVPVAPWRTGRITLLGDAIHAMTPYRGVGANVAIKDAVRLKRALADAHHGERDLIEAIRAYEDGMRDYGFRAVQNSLRAMHQTVTDNIPGLLTSRLLFRTINTLPRSSD